MVPDPIFRRQVEERVRLDKWLWAARFFKTRTLAHDAIEGGHVHLNGERTKPSRAPRIGDELTITRGQLRHVVVVQALSEHRGSAEIASKLYTETEASVKAREQMLVFLRATALPDPRKEIRGRPSKKDRRQIDRLRRR